MINIEHNNLKGRKEKKPKRPSKQTDRQTKTLYTFLSLDRNTLPTKLSKLLLDLLGHTKTCGRHKSNNDSFNNRSRRRTLTTTTTMMMMMS